MATGGTRAVIAALLANLGIAVAKFVGFLITSSASLLAEAIHSAADSGNQGLLLLGGARARRQPTPLHPFGFGRERYFWAFVVAVVLFALGSLFSLFEGYEKLRHPHELTSPVVGVGILILAIALETWSFRTAVHEADLARGRKSWWQFVRHSKSPELPVVLLEDLGALVGMIIALIGLGLATVTGNATWDAVGTLAIGALLGVIAILLCIEMKGLLIGESASVEQQRDLRRAIEAGPGVRRLIHMRTQHLGPEELLVGAKVELDPGLTFAQVAQAINDTEEQVRARVPSARVLYLEPDLHVPDRVTQPG